MQTSFSFLSQPKAIQDVSPYISRAEADFSPGNMREKQVAIVHKRRRSGFLDNGAAEAVNNGIAA